jgi:hypothetical protein
VRAVADRHRIDAALCGHLQVVLGVADHQTPRPDAEFVEQFREHLRMGFGEGLVGTARGMETSARGRFLPAPVEPARLLPVATASR